MATPTPALPTLVVFAGAFHTTDYLAPLSSTLTQDGFRVACHSLPSVGSGSVGLADDVASMAAVLDGLIDGQAKDVVLVLHSYAGIPGSVVIGGRSKTAREKAGKAGGIVGVVYIGALLPRESDSLFTLVRSVWPEWLHINTEADLAEPSNLIEQFYHDCEPAEAAALAKLCNAHSLTALTDAAPSVGWAEYDGRRAFIKCLDDRTVPYVAQSAYIDATAVPWITRDFQTSHSPFVSQPAETARAIREFVDIFGKSEAA